MARLIMRFQFYNRDIRFPHIPSLHYAAFGASSELDAISGRPLDISDALVMAIERLLALSLTGGTSQVPKLDSTILAAGKQKLSAEGIEGELVYLSRMLSQCAYFEAWSIQIVENNSAIGNSSRDE